VLPQPLHVLQSFGDQLHSSYFWSNVVITMKEAALGFLIGCSFAFVMGVLIAEVPALEAAFMPYLVSFQSVPIIAFAPLFLVWFGFGIWSKVMIAATIIFFPLMVNVEQGLKATDPAMVDMLRAFGANEWQIFWRARLKFALPQIFTGLDIAVVFAVGGAVVGEFVGAKGGLGFQTLQANFSFDIAQLFAVLIALGAMGVTGHLVVRALQRRVVFWR
jgi:NitT/TauT family transport system permease protein